MTAKMKTVCVGRFLIDLPGDALVSLQKSRINGLDIATFEESREEFLANLADRQEEISARPDRLGGQRNLESARDVMTSSGLEGKIFVHSRTVTEGTRARGLDIERYRYEGVAIEAMLHGHGVTIELSADDYRLDLVDELPRLVELAVPNPGSRVPPETGFCVENAYFRDPAGIGQRETIMLVASLPTHPDITLDMILMSGLKPESKGLLERRAESPLMQAMLAKLWIKALRLAPRTIGKLTGDEVAERVAEQNDTVGYTFQWEVNGTEDNVLRPHLSFSMMTGNGNYVSVPSSLSEDAAIELWDRIVSTIRHHTVIAPIKPTPTPPDIALGTRAAAGEPCLQGGWWQCSDSRNGLKVLGGSRQYIVQGERMPQALLLPAQGMWQRFRGLQPSFESATPTVWTLSDKRQRARTPPDVPLAAPASVSAVSGAGAAPTGSLCLTGQPCPASGWWRCEDRTALDGARWFAHGSLLPPATFMMPRRQFGLPLGRQAPVTRRSSWKLMRLAVEEAQVEPADVATAPLA